MTQTCKALDCAYVTLQKKIAADPELQELLSNLRHQFDDELLNGAESVLQLALKKANEDLTNSLKATFFILNNKGRPRGYTPPTSREQPLDGSETEIRGAVREAQKSARDPAPSGSAVAPVPPVPHQGQPRAQDPVQPELGAAATLDELFPL